MTLEATARDREDVGPRRSHLPAAPPARIASGDASGGLRIALVGNALPRRCGIATFTTDLHAAIAARLAPGNAMIVAMNESGAGHAYPPSVAFSIADDDPASYRRAARRLDAMGLDAVGLQHEFGIFGGTAGAHILELIERLSTPLVTTLHTVLARPDPVQRTTLARIAEASRRLIVMSDRGRGLLSAVYGVAAAKIDVVPHGVPDLPFLDPAPAKAALGFAGRAVILTFGLLAPSKGIEVMIAAMPRVLAATPSAVYVVLGATHPNLLRSEGEAYRERLRVQVAALGIADSVVFLDRFVDQATLLDFIAMCDVYVTPYLNEEQMTSGTLAYSFGLGKAVVSTPYWHARDLLAGGLGRLVPFGDVDAIAQAVGGLLEDPPLRETIRRGAYALGRGMIWSAAGQGYLRSVARAIAPASPALGSAPAGARRLALAR